MSKTDENLKIAFADESQTNIEYLAYAHRAIDEGFMEIAQLFREAAGAEVVHALSHLQAIGIVKNHIPYLHTILFQLTRRRLDIFDC